jgi:hypothetical protein
MANDFDREELSRLGFSIVEAADDHVLLIEHDSENQVIVWKVGGWLQFRCRVYDLGAGVGSSRYVALSETINRMHDLALGARVSVSDAGEVALVADVLHSLASNEVVATMCRQLLFLSDCLYGSLDRIAQGGSSLSGEEIDSLLSSGE